MLFGFDLKFEILNLELVMHIGIDGNEANVENLVGVSVYTQNLLTYFQKKANKNTRFTVFLREEPKKHLPKGNLYYRYHVVRPSFLFSQLTLPLALMKFDDIDVFFSPAHYAPRMSPSPNVVTIHDLSYFYFPKEFLKKDLYQLKNWTKYSVKKAKKIICVSQATKKDLIKFYKTPSEKIKVIYNGYEKNNRTLNVKTRTFGLKEYKYILYVGTLQPRKNLKTLITAFQKFHKENKDFKLVIAGKKGWLYDEIFSLVKKMKMQENVVFTGFVSDLELHNLYKNAFCFVLPSFYEGFGIPMLEAMAHDLPVIAAGSSALPEVGGDACLYFDPYYYDTLTRLLKRIKKDERLRKTMIEKGKKRVQLFSWSKCAEETLKVLKSVV